MDDQKPANESNEPGLNKIDLTQLNSFTFGTQWTEAKVSAPSQRRDRDFDRGDRRDDGHRGGPPGGQRDRRSFHKPAGAPMGPTGGGGAGAPSGPSGAPQGDRRNFNPGGGFNRGDRPPQGQGDGYRGGPRREFQGGQGGERRDYRGHDNAQFERGPYISPYFNITCYPEDAGFAALVKAVRTSCRTFQLFEITKAVLEKNDRFVLVIQRKTEDGAPAPQGSAPAEPAKAAKSAPLYLSLPDHLPFETEEAAINHVLKNNLAHFFETADVEVDPPKGNFPIINKCSITGELLGPPNHHRYQHVLQQHHATKLSRMSFDQFRDSIVSVREPEVVQQWMEKMKKVTRYTWRPIAPKPASAAPIPTDSANPVVAPESVAAPEAAAPAEVPAPAPAAEVPAGPSFDSFDEARAYLLMNAKDKAVRALETIRFHGKLLEKLPAGEMKRAIEGHVERQRRFPLDTANALRGRLRREGFTIFKKGSRGVSYVCAVKRHFRVPGQVFSVSITGLIDFIEKNPMIPVKDLPLKFLKIDLAAAVAATPVPEGTTASPMPHLALPPEQADALRKMNNDLRWLVTEGYVTEFSDGKLFAPPPVAPQAAKRGDDHGEEHDPVDFPDAPPAVAASNPPVVAKEPEAPAPAPQAEPAETVPSTEAVPAAEAPAPTETPKPDVQA